MVRASKNMAQLLLEIESQAVSPEDGLREEIFLLVSRLTPLINVDLFIQDGHRRTLLTWRDDRFYGPGWHVPGGIIRYKELASNRVRTVAREELGTEVRFDDTPVSLHQVITPDARDRAHFLSLLYRCHLLGPLDERRRFVRASPEPGQWEWHDHCPENLISEQLVYENLFG